MKVSKEEIGDAGGLNFLLVKKRVVEHISWQVWNLNFVAGHCGSDTDFEMLLQMIVPLFTSEGIWKCQG
jgi:hypothetical protein